MRTNIIQIGNSQGVILPTDLLRKLCLSLKSSVEVKIEDEGILIKPSPRQGWAQAFKEFADSGSEEKFFHDFYEDEDLSWWTWEENKK